MLTFELIHGDSKVYGSSWGDGGRARIFSGYDRFYVLKRGEILVRVEGGQDIYVAPGKLYLFPGGETARYYSCSNDTHLCWLHARAETFPGISLFTHFDPPSGIRTEFDNLAIISDALATLQSDSPVSRMQGIQSLTKLYEPFLPEDWDDLFPHQHKTEQLNPALNYIHSNLDRSLSLEELAGTVHLHPTYLSNVFKQVYGKPPLQYHKEQRMRWACSLLLGKNKTISEVAFLCGYDDPLYFSRQFRKHIGVSPRDYRQRRGQLQP